MSTGPNLATPCSVRCVCASACPTRTRPTGSACRRQPRYVAPLVAESTVFQRRQISNRLREVGTVCMISSQAVCVCVRVGGPRAWGGAPHRIFPLAGAAGLALHARGRRPHPGTRTRSLAIQATRGRVSRRALRAASARAVCVPRLRGTQGLQATPPRGALRGAARTRAGERPALVRAARHRPPAGRWRSGAWPLCGRLAWRCRRSRAPTWHPAASAPSAARPSLCRRRPAAAWRSGCCRCRRACGSAAPAG
jgi:hypothetical protein